MASVRSRRASSMASFSAMDRPARRCRYSRLLCRILARSKVMECRRGILDVHTFIVSRASCSSRELQLARRPVCRQRCCRAGATFATSIKRTTDKRELREFIAETPGETAAPRRCGEGEVNSHHHESFSFRIDSSKLRRAFSSYLCVAPISCA